MEKVTKNFVKDGFYVKSKNLFDGFEEFSSKQNLLEQDVQLPCSRVVNGFRIFPEWIDEYHQNYIWYILPNHSSMRFYFCAIRFAENFANSFKNNHSDAFWYARWIPVYSKQSVIKLFPLNFYED